MAIRIKWLSVRAIGFFGLALILTSSTVAAEATCPSMAVVPPGDFEKEINSGGRARHYWVHVPPGYTARNPLPVVLVFHGGLGTGKYIRKQSRMTPVADRHGFLAVFPDGIKGTWNAGGCCEVAMRQNIDDVGFVANLINQLQTDFCIDSQRIYATGFSNGSMLSHRLACELSDKIAAIAPVSGVIMVPECHPKEPVSVMVFHGTADPRSLWEGGIGDKDPSKGRRDSIPTTMDKLYRRYQCGSTKPSLRKGAALCSSTQCNGGAEVSLCRLEGAGHQWPGGPGLWQSKLGPVNYDISASELMWQFFSKHPKRSRKIGDK